MVIFILIFFASIIAVGAAAVFGFSFYLKRRAKSLETNNQKQFTGEVAPKYHSLFEPDEEEIRLVERAEAVRIEAENTETARRISVEKIESAQRLQTIFLENPNRKNAIELLFSGASSGSAKTFSETAESVIKIWRENKIQNLTATDLADLLDSHVGLLSQQERASGAMFWLKQEIKNLREKSEANN